ncbi:CynX/NimT family MFS transporter [Nocardioides marmotae]|uniref:MFS transporter n=1 Tax=Nocardioides marmotae TaxID=2663857 RepID=UPI0012B553FD|nr:MFS transporter [Nocardioides marmotae]MBC9732812.1 MFS transporter [Nocardioides marmotae]MTB83926.1 MFS transporter [Nocardioides marmotae]
MQDRGSGAGTTIAVVCAAATLALIPAFLMGAVGPVLRRDLGFGADAMGGLVSCYWVFMALAGVVSGRWVEVAGPRASLLTGSAISAVALLVCASAPSVWMLFVGMALAGVASAMATPGTDVLVFRRVPQRLHGLAFGIKQSSLPAASMFAGLGVPLLALTVGWRATFVAAAFLAVPVWWVVRSEPRKVPEARAGGATAATRPGGPSPRMVWLVLGMMLAMGAVSAMGAFYVESVTQRGISTGVAGLFLALGSAGGVVGRFALTWRIPDTWDPFVVAAACVGVGSIGSLGLATTHRPDLLAVLTVVTFTSAWGWNGLFTRAVLALDPAVAARSSAKLVTASATGGVLGPLAFGALAEPRSLTAGWCAVSAVLMAAAVSWFGSTWSSRCRA